MASGKDTAKPPGPRLPVAGGLKALTSTAHHLRRETGLVRGFKALSAMNQLHGFDCPGCAWPEPEHRSSFEYCENGAKALAEEATRKRLSPEIFAQHSLPQLRAMSDFELSQLGRITHPMWLAPGSTHYQPISWDDAFTKFATKLQSLASPHRAAFYTSGRTSNEAAFLLQLMVRLYGTNNLPDCSNLCHESSGVALRESLGVSKGTVSLDDFSQADLIFVIGQNPGTNHPRMLSTLRDAAHRGATIVSINPLREAGLVRFAHPQKPLDLFGGHAMASQFVRVRIGGDMAFFRGLAKSLFELGDDVLDLSFISEFCAEYEAYRAHVLATSWPEIEQGCGVSREQISDVANLYALSSRTIACWAMGLTQHPFAVATIQEIVNVMLLRGNVGKSGAGVCPVRGHSNVQGDRTMGITVKPNPTFLQALSQTVNVALPTELGLDVVGTITAMARGEIDCFFAMGGNFYSASPDTDFTERALMNCALSAHVTTKLNRTHLFPGQESLLLPCLGRSELDLRAAGPQFVTVEDSMSLVHPSQGRLEPVSSEVRSEPSIVCELARRLLPSSHLPWQKFADDYSLIRQTIGQVIPELAELDQKLAANPHGIRLRNPATHREFFTSSGKANFVCSELPDLQIPAGYLRLMTIRTHDQYNTTIYGLNDRYRGIAGERNVVMICPDDAAARNLVQNDRVDIVSIFRDGERRAYDFRVHLYDLPPGAAAAYFPETNVLVPLHDTAAKSGTPASKSVIVRLEKCHPNS